MIPVNMFNNHRAQLIARETLIELNSFLRVGMTEQDISDFVCTRMKEKGSGEFWYHGCGALVLIGDRSRLSISGRDYVPDPHHRIRPRDIVTVDCSPSYNGAWGDFARTFFFENGEAVPLDSPADPEFERGLKAELRLQQVLTVELNPDMTYDQIYNRLMKEIEDLGFVNLDFHGNLGHSIETDEKDRICIEAGNYTTVRAHGKPITLEPHIALPDGKFGYKRENVYYFVDDWFVCL